MKRSNFIKLSGAALAGSTLVPTLWSCSSKIERQIKELGEHRIDKYELAEVEFHWPRFVGKNSRLDFHGQYHKNTVLKLYTDQGAMAWGVSSKNADKIIPLILNKKVSELITPGIGIIDTLDSRVDIALHDLMGLILNKPVYELIGNQGPRETLIYSGMIYLDELNPGNETKGLDVILENCEWDYNYGYRQLKVKIGRSGMWYPHKEGLEKDIEVVNLVHNTFKDRNTKVLVDANDKYSLEDTISFLTGIQEVPLYWMEEPFFEELEAGRKLKRWMNNNGFENTYYADGERDPDYDVCLELGKEQVMDVMLADTIGYGFTKWMKLMPELKKINMLASPHSWGSRFKTNYNAHLSAGLGNVCTIEGVTCLSDDVDFGEYPIINGKLRVSDAPGFGMKLLKK